MEFTNWLQVPLPTNKEKNDNIVALIIGIESYKNSPKASFANSDAKFFYE